MSDALHYRAKIASLTRSRQPDDPELVAARRNLTALRLEEHVQKVLAAAVPLTDEQRTRLAELLRPARESIARDRQAIMGGRITELGTRATGDGGGS